MNILNQMELYVENIPDDWASHWGISYLFQWHAVGSVKQTTFMRSEAGGFRAHVVLDDTHCDWSNLSEPIHLAYSPTKWMTLVWSDATPTADMATELNSIRAELVEIRREIGLQCAACSNRHELEEDEDDLGKWYCRSCWYEWNNEEAIRSKERDIASTQTEINRLWSSEDPERQYKVEELLEYIQERRDEIAMLKNTPKL